LRRAVAELASELPPTAGTLADWVCGAEPIVTAYLRGFVRERHSLDHVPSRLLKARNRYDKTPAHAMFNDTAEHLTAETVHAVKGRSIDGVLLVIEAPTPKRDSASDLLTALSNTDVTKRETVRIAYVALTRARKYCAIAIADTVPSGTSVGYQELGFVGTS
jgi:superfamily I DNA/RNA helicase